MSRPLRLEYEGAIYHVTARGNSGQHIYKQDQDREKFLALFAREISQQRWLCHAYCLMGTHYHILLETPEPNLSRGMGRLNSCYAQWFNWRHQRYGHLMQGRYKAILVEKESYLLELCRYIVLNPVRTQMVETSAQWQWSSYRATAGLSPVPPWLCTEWILSHFGSDLNEAWAVYRSFVADGLRGSSPWKNLRGQMYLGSEGFRRLMAARIKSMDSNLEHVNRAVQLPERPISSEIVEAVGKSFGLSPEQVLNRKEHQEAFQLAVYLLRRAANVPRREVASITGISPSRVSHIQQRFYNSRGCSFSPQIRKLLGKCQVTR